MPVLQDYDTQIIARRNPAANCTVLQRSVRFGIDNIGWQSIGQVPAAGHSDPPLTHRLTAKTNASSCQKTEYFCHNMMAEKEKLRLDKYLWSIRLFKTRSQAADACDKGRVKFNGDAAKASRTVNVGDEYDVKAEARRWRIKVTALL